VVVGSATIAAAQRRFRAARQQIKQGGFMDRITKAAGILCTIVAVAVFSIESSAADSAKDMAALQAVDQAWLSGYNAGNADALASLYDEQAVLLPPGVPAVNGRAAIKAFFAKDTAETQKAGLSFSLGAKPAGGISGDMGWQSGTYAVKDKAGKIVEAGKYLSVSMKKGGKWLYVRDTWNADTAPAPIETAAPAKK
jgi:ketosteroid isomerase-like protein